VPAFCGQHGSLGAPARDREKPWDPEAEALGRSQGGFNMKKHLWCERGGKPLVVLLTGG